MKRTLRQITDEALEIYENVEEMHGEITEEMQMQLVINEKELQVKGIAYVEIINDRKSYISRLDVEIKRLQAKKKANNNLIDNLEYNLLEATKTFGDIDLGLTIITTRKSESVSIEDVNLLPKEYKTVKIVETADKLVIKKALKNGLEIKGAKLIVNKNLKIK